MSEAARSERHPVDDAQQMGEWFSDYVYGLTSEIGFVPDIVKARIDMLCGEDAAVDEVMSRLRTMILDFADSVEDQTNAVLYVCGYPDEAIEQLGMGDTRSTIGKIEQYFGVVAEPEADVCVPRRIARPAMKQTVHIRVSNDESQPQPIGLLASLEDLEDVETPAQWQDRALCAQVDSEMFFPEKGGSTREAKSVCARCEVKDECLSYALENGERFGIWGGLSERERRRLQRGIV